MKTVIIGANSFIAQSLYPYLRKDESNSIVMATKSDADAMNLSQLKYFLKRFKPDAVINCAVKGGRRTHADNWKDFKDNIIMVENLLQLRDFYNQLILFSSGAAFDRRYPIYLAKEFPQIDECTIPIDPYGRSKWFNDQTARGYDGVTNLRLFNCFDSRGMKDSFLYTCVKKCQANEDVRIWENIYFDTISARNLSLVVDFFLKNPSHGYREINCVHTKKYRLSDLARIISDMTFSRSKIFIEKYGENHYCGDGTLLSSLPVKLRPMEGELRSFCEHVTYEEELKTENYGIFIS